MRSHAHHSPSQFPDSAQLRASAPRASRAVQLMFGTARLVVGKRRTRPGNKPRPGTPQPKTPPEKLEEKHQAVRRPPPSRFGLVLTTSSSTGPGLATLHFLQRGSACPGKCRRRAGPLSSTASPGVSRDISSHLVHNDRVAAYPSSILAASRATP